MSNRKQRLLFFYLIMFFTTNISLSQIVIIYSPEGKSIISNTASEYSEPEIAYLNAYGDSLVAAYSLNAARIGPSSGTYSCHSYAWVVSEGGPIVQLGGDNASGFYQDGGWSNDGLPSYLPASENEATQADYGSYNHSARKIQNSYPTSIEGGRDYVSKWGDCGLYQHAKNHDPYYEKRDWGLTFFKLKATHYGTLSNYNKTWLGAGGISHFVTGTVIVPAGVTLTIKPGVTVYFSSGTSLIVNGTLNASQVTFTSNGTWGGVQFNSGSSGNLDGCTVQNVNTNGGAAISMNGCSPTIQNCTINNLQGSTIGIAVWSSSSTPYLYNNNIQSTSHGIYLYQSTACIQSNTITAGASSSAIASFNYSSARFYPGNGNNVCQNSYNGISAAYYSNIYAGGDGEEGSANSFKNNINYNAFASIGSEIFACNNAWNPLPPQKVYYDRISNIDYAGYYLGKSIAEITGDEFIKELNSIMKLRYNKNYALALKSYISLLNKYSFPDVINKIICELSELYKETTDVIIKQEVIKLLIENLKNNSIQPFVYEALANINFNDSNIDECMEINQSIASQFPGTIYEKNALINLFTIYYNLGDLPSAEHKLSLISEEYLKGDEVLFANWLLKKEDKDAFRYDRKPLDNNNTSDKYYVIGNFPNPFNPSTTISYNLPHVSDVELVIYDIMGKEVNSFNIYSQSAGVQEIFWNGKNNNGEVVASGIYLYTLKFKSLETNDSFEKTAKLIMLK